MEKIAEKEIKVAFYNIDNRGKFLAILKKPNMNFQDTSKTLRSEGVSLILLSQGIMVIYVI